jgi:calnexin
MIFHVLIVVVAALAVVSRAQEGVIFYETFDEEEDVFASKWVKSSDPKYANQPLKIKTPTRTIPGYETDKGVQLTQEMRHYGFGAKFAQPLVANGSDIVLQYELKMEEKLACGGAYIKMLREDASQDLSELTNESQYVIMFGPDKCGTESKVHFILKHQNPVTKEWSEHHYAGELKPKLDRSTHLYTLVIRSDNKFEMHIDTKPVAHGSLLENLDPPINPPEMINDPTDFKPADWVDDAFIPDVTATKPAEWDESQPRKIPDGKQVKPKDWDESMPEKIPDPKVAKLEIWDDEEVRQKLIFIESNCAFHYRAL